MKVTIAQAPVQPPPVRAVQRHYLLGPHERHYEFVPVEDGVVVRRHVGDRVEWRQDMTVGQARSRWAWLRKLGYERV